jgi:hypothetical protein
VEYIVGKCRGLQFEKAIPSPKKASRRPHSVNQGSIPDLHVLDFK